MTEPQRPDPDVLLAEIQREARAAKRGQLRIFFGMCPGVGKTYAMLRAAQQRKAEGIDLVVGLVETHGRTETESLLAGLPVIPRKSLEHRGVTLTEMDLDALLARRPQLALVDELAHTNVLGSRHPKRYQDVLELLDAGIDVYTTLNVQHLESRVDVVRKIIGVSVRETVPDSVVDQAAEIELIDLTPEQLRRRLAEGKVYLGERADAAAQNFFREENLTALREMALRCTAERVDQELRDVMRAKRISGVWQSGQRLAVAVGPSPFSGSLIRWTRRIAAAMDAPWVAIYVETPDVLTEDEKIRLTNNLSLARQLGAEVVMTRGDDVADAMLEAAREESVTQLVVGRPAGHPLMEWLRGGSLVSKLMRRSGDIDIHVIRAETGKPRAHLLTGRHWGTGQAREYSWGAAAVVAVTLVSWFLKELTGYQAVGILYLLCVTMLATVMSRRVVLFAAALSSLLWDYLFIPPPFTFRVSSLQDQLMLGMYFIVVVVVGRVTNRLRVREALHGPLVHVERADDQWLVCLGLLVAHRVLGLSGSVQGHCERFHRVSLPKGGGKSRLPPGRAGEAMLGSFQPTVPRWRPIRLKYRYPDGRARPCAGHDVGGLLASGVEGSAGSPQLRPVTTALSGLATFTPAASPFPRALALAAASDSLDCL